jgi:hypothetical protein
MERIETTVTRAQQDEVRTLEAMLTAIAAQSTERDALDGDDFVGDFADDGFERAGASSPGAVQDLNGARRPDVSDSTNFPPSVVPLPERTLFADRVVPRRAPLPPPPGPAAVGRAYIVPEQRGQAGPSRRTGRRWQP